MKYKHYIITRFNSLYFRNERFPESIMRESVYREIDEKYLNESWLKSRIELFESFALPSVLGQTTNNFEFLLLINDQTPKHIKTYFETYNTPLIKTIFSSYSDKESSTKYMKENKEDENFVVSTNLDSDDALHKDFVKCIQSKLKNRTEFLNMPRGYVYSTKENKVFGRRSTENPFITFVEKASNIQSVYRINHKAASKVAPVRQIYDDVGRWLQVVHGDNLVNKLAKRSKDKGFPLDRIKKDFSL